MIPCASLILSHPYEQHMKTSMRFLSSDGLNIAWFGFLNSIFAKIFAGNCQKILPPGFPNLPPGFPNLPPGSPILGFLQKLFKSI